MNDGWSQPGLPHKGWTWVDVYDLGDLVGHCEMCGTEIRYVHAMEHPEWHDRIGVGCVCAENLSKDYAGPRAGEERLKKLAGRRTRWLQRKWKQSKAGNSYLNVDRSTLRNAGRDNPDSINVVVFQTHNGRRWSVRIGGTWVPGKYSSERDAKLAAFDTLRPK